MIHYSLLFERGKLGTLSTKVIKEQVRKIKNKCQSIAAMSERGMTENSSTTDTAKNGRYLDKIMKQKSPLNNNHIIAISKKRNFNKIMKPLNPIVKRRKVKRKMGSK